MAAHACGLSVKLSSYQFVELSVVVAVAAALSLSELRTEESEDLFTNATATASKTKIATVQPVILFMTLLDLPPKAESLFPPKIPPSPESSSLWIETRKIRKRLTRTKRTKRMILKTAIFYLPIINQQLMIGRNCSSVRDAPPTNAPSMCSQAISSLTFEGFTDPPYCII